MRLSISADRLATLLGFHRSRLTSIYANPLRCNFFTWSQYVSRAVDEGAITRDEACAWLRYVYHLHAQQLGTPTAQAICLDLLPATANDQ